MSAQLSPTRKDARTQGRIILAEGEATGHCHEVVARDTEVPPDLASAQFFEEPDGRRVLLVLEPCVLRHQEHGFLALTPTDTQDYAQGDVYLQSIGAGCWHVRRQSEQMPEGWRNVAD